MKNLVLQVRFLTGRYVATAYNDRERAEWPPHPARAFSALLAAWADREPANGDEQPDEAGDGNEQPDEARTALEWLAELAPPRLFASACGERSVVPYFVPVNDVGVLKDFSNDKSAELEGVLTQAKFHLREAQARRDAKAEARAKKEVDKLEKQYSKARSKLADAKLRDQQIGKVSGEGLRSARAVLPEHRLKQQRFFPSVAPHESLVCFIWTAPEQEVKRHAPAIDQLAREVVRIGHSSSLVSCSVTAGAPPPTWEPSELGSHVFRVPGPGQVAHLERAYAQHGGVDPRVLPCRFQRYRSAGTANTPRTVCSTFDDDWIVFRQRTGRRLSLTSCVGMAQAIRDALLVHADHPEPVALTGKTTEGADAPHVALVPLPFVGHRHATGEILGLAVVPPRGMSDSAKLGVLRAVANWEESSRQHAGSGMGTPLLAIDLNRSGRIEFERVEWDQPSLITLRSATWCRASTAWVTATPIALDRNPGDLYSRDLAKCQAAHLACEASIALSCERIGLPSPLRVEIHPSIPLRGAAKARFYPGFPTDPSRPRRVKVHARIEFPVPVGGPLLLGAGRYLGLGLCFPVDEGIS